MNEPAPTARYELSRGRILTWALETHVVDHCNLRCENCCTLSPHLAPWAVDVQELRRDLESAAVALRPQIFKLTGGEPLLHPDIVGCIEAARAAGIAEEISLTTNGILLPRAPDAVFEALDRITVSFYTSAPLGEPALGRIGERCARHDVVLTVKPVGRFQRMDATTPHAADEAREIYARCWLRRRCHMIRRGRFFTCTRPPHLADRLSLPDLGNDGVDLSGHALLDRLLAYLESEEPLAACTYCLGAGGAWMEHRQLPHGREPSSQQLPTPRLRGKG